MSIAVVRPAPGLLRRVVRLLMLTKPQVVYR
jgi:hypothetical protein